MRKKAKLLILGRKIKELKGESDAGRVYERRNN